MTLSLIAQYIGCLRSATDNLHTGRKAADQTQLVIHCGMYLRPKILLFAHLSLMHLAVASARLIFCR